MIICETHGATGSTMACFHVWAFTKTRVVATVIVVKDDLGDPVSLCKYCHSIYGDRIDEMTFEDGPTRVCYECLLEWDAELLHSDLEVRILRRGEIT